MEEQNNNQNPEITPQKTAVAPQKTAVAPQKTAVAPQKTAVAPQKTAVAPGMGAPQKTAVAPGMGAPQKTAVAPGMAAPQKTAVAPGMGAPQKTAVAPGMGAAPQAPKGDAGAATPQESITVGGKTYKILKSIGSGTEGDIFVVTDGKKRYALKHCHGGFQTNMKVMPALQKLNGKGYIADIVDCGPDFELLKFAPEGSAAYADIRGNAMAITAIAIKTAMVLSEMHKMGIIHKDVKPANILLTSTETWNSMLCDFGIADVLGEDGRVSTPQTRTGIYAAPEVYDPKNTINKDGGIYCELTAAADYYSLGMTILSLWMGEGAFTSREIEQKMAMDKQKGRITVPDDIPDPLNKICRGLLIKDPAKRWDFEKIERLLNGEDVPVDEAEIIEDLNITFNAAKHLTANNPMELADCMEQDPEMGTRYLYRGQIEKWLQPYPELAVQMQEIVEKRFPKNQELGLYAAICALNPALPFHLEGTARESDKAMMVEAISLKDVSNFCNDAIVTDQTANDLSSEKFKEWVRVRNAAIIDTFPKSEEYNELSDTYMLRVQMIDPLTDINLRNDTSHPDYAMTGEALGRFFNKVYNIFWNVCDGDLTKVKKIWNKPEHAPLNRQIPATMVIKIAACFIDTAQETYITSFFNTKGRRFNDQTRYFLDATDNETEDFQEKAGPKDDTFFAQMSWMKVIKGFGATPEYLLVDSDKTVTTIKEVFKESKKVLQKEYNERGLMGFLAVNRMEDPDANLKPQFAYEQLLHEYLEDIAKIDDKQEPVVRFREAVKEADKLLSEGKGKIRALMARSMLQHVLTILFALIPALLLLIMLVFSIFENPLVDTSGLTASMFIILGLILGLVVYIYFTTQKEDVGCVASLIIGGILSAILWAFAYFLGQFILYFYAAITLAVLGFFSFKTVFSRSKYAAEARKFEKAGFDEKVLEPLYYAFADDDEPFDSSLNGAFNDDDIVNWKADLKVRRLFILLFIGAVWFLLVFSAFIPKSERFNKYTAPFVEKLMPKHEVKEEVKPYLEPTLTLKKGDNGENVKLVQQFLKEQGYTKNTPDGDFGPGTKKAVEAFQKAQGLETTGIVDAKTIEAINKIVAEAAKEEAAAEEETEKKSEETTSKKKSATEKAATDKPAATEKAKAKPAKEKSEPQPAQESGGTGFSLTPVNQRSNPAPANSNQPSVSLDQLQKMSEKNN